MTAVIGILAAAACSRGAMDFWTNSHELARAKTRLEMTSSVLAERSARVNQTAAAARAAQPKVLGIADRLDMPWDGAFTVLERAVEASKGTVSVTSLHRSLSPANSVIVTISGTASATEPILSLLEAIEATPGVTHAFLASQERGAAADLESFHLTYEYAQRSNARKSTREGP